MEPYFSQNFASHSPKIKTYKQQLFIDVRDYAQDIIDNNGNLEFTVMWSNGRHTIRNNAGTTIGGSWNDSLSIPPYNHVTQVELLGVTCPPVYTVPNAVTLDDSNKHLYQENYFILDIPEFDRVVHSSDNAGSHEKFAVVYFDSGYRPLKGKDFIPKVCTFNPPLSSLNKMTIRFKKYDGTVLNIVSDSNHFYSVGTSHAISSSSLTRGDNTLLNTLKNFTLLFEFTIKE